MTRSGPYRLPEATPSETWLATLWVTGFILVLVTAKGTTPPDELLVFSFPFLILVMFAWLGFLIVWRRRCYSDFKEQHERNVHQTIWSKRHPYP